ncbi:hypothetical protein B0I33_109200 [Prauserella shujinwangii]|uniref:Uncharacterized protein n=1 Tax=Prauserella shujinwangii TaxID=1453103 RepID=A0A2T0LQA8_9PSEU|nr:hypothetical protein B0I33_109200 [Prauserella shujinwangii]
MPAPPPPPQPPPQHHGPDGTLSARLDGLGDATSEPGAPEQPGPPVPPPPQAGGYPAPPLRRRPLRGAPPPAAEPNTEQFPAVSDGPAPPEAHAPDAAPNVDEPPAGLSGWRGRRTSRRERDPVAQEDTEVGVMPAVPPGPGGAADAGPPTGHFVPDFDDEDDYGDGPGFGGRARTGVLDDDPLGEGGTAVGYAGEPYDDYEDEPYDEYAADTDDDLDDADADDAEAFPEAAEEPSPARQWLALAGQLALGVVGGAGVWLAFNWLWVQLPAAALVAALVVTVGLVWIVRRVRRAEDLQTTVLALLVGLVVTVSPAALLLVSR